MVFKAAVGRSKVAMDYFFRKTDIKRQAMLDGEEPEDQGWVSSIPRGGFEEADV